MKKEIETISHGKEKKCGICLLNIDDSKEYAELIHYLKKDKIKGKDYYHITCYSQKLTGTRENQKIQAVCMDTLLKAREKLGIGERC